MQKDFQRETVVQGGDLEARVREHCSGLRAVDDASAVFPPQRPEAAQALAKAALRAVWRTRVGLDAWDRARTHLEGRRAAEAATEAHVAEAMSSTSSKAPSLCDGSTVQASDDDDVSDAEDHALVSRPTEPPTTIDAFVDGRVVCTAYSHLSEVRCDGAGERSFMHKKGAGLRRRGPRRRRPRVEITRARAEHGEKITVTVPAGTASGALFVVPLPGISPPSVEE